MSMTGPGEPGRFSRSLHTKQGATEEIRQGETALSEKKNPIRLTVGTTVIPAVLNDSKASRTLLARLPYTVRLQRYEHDYCGVMSEALPYDRASLRSGWTNGDIAYAVDGSYFAILYKGEEISMQHDGLVTMGTLSAPPEIMDTLAPGISVTIEMAG
jgi:hypothetical protein